MKKQLSHSLRFTHYIYNIQSSQPALLPNAIYNAFKDKVNDDADNEGNKILYIVVAQRNDLDLALELLALRCKTTDLNKKQTKKGKIESTASKEMQTDLFITSANGWRIWYKSTDTIED